MMSDDAIFGGVLARHDIYVQTDEVNRTLLFSVHLMQYFALNAKMQLMIIPTQQKRMEGISP